MTWEELVEVLISFGERVHVVRGDGLDAVNLPVVPVAWFMAMKATGQLNMGIYEGEENRLVGTRSIPLAELTEEFVREEVGKALAEQLSSMLDPQAVADFLKATNREKRWDE